MPSILSDSNSSGIKPGTVQTATTLKPTYPHSGLGVWASRRWGGENESKSGPLSGWYPYSVDRAAVSRTGHPPVLELLSTAFERVFHWWVVVATVVRNEVIRDGCMGYRKGGP